MKRLTKRVFTTVIACLMTCLMFVTPALLYLKIILRGTAANGTFPIVPVFNQSFRQNGSKFQYPILSYHFRLSSTDGLRFSQSAHSKAGR